MTIGERIFALLDKNSMTQKEFSEQTGISQSTISEWKRRNTNPSADKILKICEVLHVTPYELLAESTVDADSEVDYVIALNETEEIVLENFRNLGIRQKERLLGYMDALQQR